MSWIDMDDRDKLNNYAKRFVPVRFRIMGKSNNNTGSYYIDCEDEGSLNDFAMMEYEIEQYYRFKSRLVDMWNDADFKDADLLATIVAATTLKNMPKKPAQNVLREREDNSLQASLVKKESFEKVSNDSTPSTFVYEF